MYYVESVEMYHVEMLEIKDCINYKLQSYSSFNSFKVLFILILPHLNGNILLFIKAFKKNKVFVENKILALLSFFLISHPS